MVGGLSGEAEFAEVRFAVSPYKVSLIATPLFMKPGLPFHIKVSYRSCIVAHDNVNLRMQKPLLFFVYFTIGLNTLLVSIDLLLVFILFLFQA